MTDNPHRHTPEQSAILALLARVEALEHKVTTLTAAVADLETVAGASRVLNRLAAESAMSRRLTATPSKRRHP